MLRIQVINILHAFLKDGFLLALRHIRQRHEGGEETGAVEQDAEIARQDRSEWVFAIEIYSHERVVDLMEIHVCYNHGCKGTNKRAKYQKYFEYSRAGVPSSIAQRYGVFDKYQSLKWRNCLKKFVLSTESCNFAALSKE